MPKYTHSVTLEDGQNVTFTTPVKMSDLEIYQRAVQEQGIKSGRIPTTKIGGYIKEDFGGASDIVTNPELVAGAASLIPGVGTAAAGAIGAGTSLVRDLSQGGKDPQTMATNAVIHGGVNMIPGGVAALMAKKGLPAATGMAADAVTGGKVGMISALMKHLGLGKGAATHTTNYAMKQATKPATLEVGGVPLVSYRGLQLVKDKMNVLANQGQALGDAEFDALNALVTRITASLEGGFVPMSGLAKEGGMAATNAAERAVLASQAELAAATAKAAATGKKVGQAVRGALAGGSLLTLARGDKK